MNKETRNGPKNIMTESNVPFRIRRDLSVFAEIDNYVANQETKTRRRLAAVRDINLPAKHANNTNPRETGGRSLFADTWEGCVQVHD